MIDSSRCANGLNFLFWPVVIAVAIGTVVAVTARPARAAIRTQTITYSQDSVTLEGYLAYDDRITGKRPGILVVHEWKGITAYEKMRVEQLASILWRVSNPVQSSSDIQKGDRQNGGITTKQ